jgi:glycerophosphoryl diester phosphodiesterase
VNEAEDAQRLRALGVDGLITDAVDRFSPAA